MQIAFFCVQSCKNIVEIDDFSIITCVLYNFCVKSIHILNIYAAKCLNAAYILETLRKKEVIKCQMKI